MQEEPESYEAIFPSGFHYLTLAEISSHCEVAEQFGRSQTRRKLMANLVLVAEQLRMARITGELWVDGSFVTAKLNPRDVDVCLRTKIDYLERGSKEQASAFQWFKNLYLTHLVDAYLLFDYPPSDPRQPNGLEDYEYWKRQWGFNRNGVPQGIVVIDLS